MANKTLQGTVLGIEKAGDSRMKFEIEGFIEELGMDMVFKVIVDKNKLNIDIEEGDTVRVIGFNPMGTQDFGRWVIKGL